MEKVPDYVVELYLDYLKSLRSFTGRRIYTKVYRGLHEEYNAAFLSIATKSHVLPPQSTWRVNVVCWRGLFIPCLCWMHRHFIIDKLVFILLLLLYNDNNL